MEPPKLRQASTVPQNLQDVADRLGSRARAEIYETLQGIGGEPDGLATLLRLEPVVNDICTQLSDSFKQAVTKRLLPEVSKLLGASGWSSQHLGLGPAKDSTHLDNGDDISPSAFVSGAGQTLGPDQGPATVATVALQPAGATQAPTQQLHAAGESRFGFAKDTAASTMPPRAVSAGGSSGTPPPGPAQRPPSAALPSNGSASNLIPSDLLGNTLPGPLATSNVIGPSGLSAAAQAPRNAAPAGVPQPQPQPPQQQETGPFTGSSLPSTLSSHNQPAAPSFASPPGAISHQLAQLTLSSSAAPQQQQYPQQQHQHQHPNGFGLLGPGLRGSSLDPGLSGPPISLPGTELLRPPAHSVVGQLGLGGGGSGQLSLLGPALGSALGPAGQQAPVPMFGGAPGPSPGSASQQQQRVQQLLLQSIQQGAGLGEEPVGAGGLSLQQLQQLQQQQQRAALAGYGGQGLPPQQQQLTNGSATLLQQQLLLQQQQARNDALAAYQLSLQQLQQQQQQQQQAFLTAAGAGTAGPAQLSGRASVDGRFAGASILQQHQQQLEQQQLLQQLQADPALLQQYLQQQQGQPPRGMGLGGGASHGPAALYRSSAGFAGDGSTPGGPGSVATNPASVGTAPSDDGIDYGSIFSIHHQHHHHQQGVPSPGLTQAVAGLPPHHPAAAGPAMAPLPMSDLRSASMSSTASGGLRDLQFGGVGGYPAGAPGMRASPPVDAQAQLQLQQKQTLAAQQQQQGVAGRLATRSGAASSVADSRSSSFSGVAGSGGGAATGGATVPSPPGSDAAGPAEGAKAQPPLSMAAKLQQSVAKPSPPATGRGKVAGAPAGPLAASLSSPTAAAAAAVKVPADMPGRFRCLPPAVQARIHTLTRDNHVVLLKDFDEKVLSKMTLLVDKFGAGECLAMLDRIEEVLKGKAGRLANGPGYLDVSVSTRLDELKQRASGQVTAPEDYARSTLHSRIYNELRDLIARHGFLSWHHFDQGIINMLKKMPNNVAIERLNELAYHSFKNVDNPKSCIVSIFTTKPKYVNV